MITLWLLSVTGFLYWWFQPEHILGLPRFVINTLLLSWTLLLPGYFFFFISRMQKPNPQLPIPSQWRVAMVVTKAPSEPWELVKKNLQAMLIQQPQHDTWLADEDPQPETINWCQQHGVKISTRKDVTAYHQLTWPRRTKCKEGNLAYFYDYYGYQNYDFVVQLDADHVPEPGYLEAMLRPFHNPKVGYVSSPSICDANARSSWSGRARLYAEAIMHGPLQAGYTNGFAPLCIGSHYAVRTKALQDIGGLGPELAEDHSTTLLMQAGGWQGVHALDAIAHGEGPATLADCLTQEFQWSRSLMVILLDLTPKVIFKLPFKLQIQFIFSQLWFPLFSLFMLAGHLLPIIAIIGRQPFVNVSYVDFVLHTLPITATTIMVVLYLRAQKLLRPVNAPIISWEIVIFQFIRWPWILFGILSGIYQTITRHEPEFKVTPKGVTHDSKISLRVIQPYVVIITILALSLIFLPEAGPASGYYYFSLLNIIIYISITVAVILLHFQENSYDRT